METWCVLVLCFVVAALQGCVRPPLAALVTGMQCAAPGLCCRVRPPLACADCPQKYKTHAATFPAPFAALGTGLASSLLGPCGSIVLEHACVGLAHKAARKHSTTVKDFTTDKQGPFVFNLVASCTSSSTLPAAILLTPAPPLEPPAPASAPASPSGQSEPADGTLEEEEEEMGASITPHSQSR